MIIMNSMNIIYLDTLFLVNFICDYILLLCTAKLSGAEIHRVMIVFSSFLGGMYACLCMHPRLSWLQQPVIQGAVSIALCILSFGREERIVGCTVSFLCVSALLGGVLSALSMTLHGQLYLPINIKATFLVFSAVYAVLSHYFKRFPRLHQNQLHTIDVTLNGRTVHFKAMRDTGNELYDPISNLPVLICETKQIEALFPNNDITFGDACTIFMRLNRVEALKTRIKLIPYRTISDKGMLWGFKPDMLMIDHKEERYIIACCPQNFSQTAAYQAIF